jgi:hypothetical protein
MVKPNLFLVGAPKCGTTALYTYLQSHRDVFFPAIKEPHYFGRDLHKDGSKFVLNRNAYVGLFTKAVSARIRGDASTNYIFSTAALREIHEFSPEAKVIVMLRPPVDLLFSAHAQYFFTGNEDVIDFWDALRAEPERLNGRRIPRFIDLREKLYYQTNLRKIPDQLRYLFGSFGAARVKVLLLEDLKNAPEMTYQDVIKFLDLPPSGAPPFRVVNARRTFRSPYIHKTLRKVQQRLGHLGPLIGASFLGQGVRRWNIYSDTVAATDQLDPGPRLALARTYNDWVKDLEDLLQRDLHHWRCP